jgi:pyrroline-5-carboxylate reductase
MPELVVVGGGRMGTALVKGLQRAGWDIGSLAVVEKVAARRNVLERELPGVRVAEARFEAPAVVIAVKPADAEEACRGSVGATAQRVLSIMAGVTTSQIEAWLGSRAAVIRAMPNTPALVGAGVSAVAGGRRATEDDLGWAESVLGSVGAVVRVSESDLDAVTGLSGSGPAYVFLLVEELTRAGVKAGLDPETSAVLARQTVVGAARLLDESGEDPAELRRQVTSPGGTTEAGLAVLTGRGLDKIVEEAVIAAAERARELGSGSAEPTRTKN